LSVPAGHELVVTTDTIVESVHFFRDDPPDRIARKALRVNLSDLAAKGAKAETYLLALSLAPWIDNEWLTRFAAGLAGDQNRYGVSLVGGDTTSTPGPLTLSITQGILWGFLLHATLYAVTGRWKEVGAALWLLAALSAGLLLLAR